jgi:hypothetical protein
VRDIGDLVGISCCLRVFAAVAARRAQGERAARLLGAAERVRADIDLSLEPSEEVLQADIATRLEQLLSQDQLAETLESGKALTWQAAIEDALGEEAMPPA